MNEQYNVSSWNIEDFINEYNFTRDKEFMSKIILNDILFIQEWKEEPGNLFVSKLNKLVGENKFDYVYVDRVCIIFNSFKFKLEKIGTTNKYYKKLYLPKPKITSLEKLYTTGRKKASLLISLKPVIEENNEINCLYCICFHLSAINPKSHLGFHKYQMETILKTFLNTNKESKYGLIMAGDTNYRGPSDYIFEELVSDKLKDEVYGNLQDICYTKCQHKKTQSFKHLHEPQTAKKIIKYISKKYTKKNYLLDKVLKADLKDNRIDFIATNLKYLRDKTKIKNLFKYSDHNMIQGSIKLEYSII